MAIEHDADIERVRLPVKKVKRPPTPLPKLQVAALFVVQLAEPVHATVIYPFITELINRLGITGGDARRVGYYAGVIESLFFLSQFLFVLHWGRLSDRGRKPVLLVGMFGLALSTICFGLSTTFTGLVVSRALAGALCANTGVVKSVMGEITDETNMAAGFATLPISWALGTSIGPVLGGFLSRPADARPDIFNPEGFWGRYPYFLPCLAAGLLAFIAFAVVYAFLKETAPSRLTAIQIKEYEALPDEHQLSYQLDYEEFIRQSTSPTQSTFGIFSLLTYRVQVSILIYGLLSMIDIATWALLPIILATPIASGGLGMSTQTIGTCLAVFGVFNGFVTLALFAPLHGKLGLRRLLTITMALYVPINLAFPVYNWFAVRAGGHLTTTVWLILCFQFLMCSVANMAFSCSFILITSSVSDRSCLGAINGIGQMTASFMRFIGPALATSLFALSSEQNLMGGYMVYFVLALIGIVTTAAARLVPEGGWKKEGELIDE